MSIEIKNYDNNGDKRVFRIEYQTEEERKIIKKKLEELSKILKPTCNW